MSAFYGMKSAGTWKDERALNLLDGAAPFYDTYQCSDGKWISVGSVEPQFYALLLEKAGATPLAEHGQMDEVALAGDEGASARRYSRPGRATNGAQSWNIPTYALHRCSA